MSDLKIEPVTDDDYDAFANLAWHPSYKGTRAALEQDRRRVAERQANHGTTHAEGCVSWGRGHYECAMVEIERLRAEVAAHRKHDVLRCDALMKAEAEVAKLNAACAAKDEAICTLRDHITVGMYRAVPHLADVAASALSDDAGTNWIDASGAVEAEASRHVVLGNTWLKDGGVLLPGDWAGSKVKIVQVQP